MTRTQPNSLCVHWIDKRLAVLAWQAGHDRTDLDFPRFKHRYKAANTYENSLWQNMLGCVGEVAASDYHGVLDQWIACSANFKKIPADIGANGQVRATTARDGRLLTHGPPMDKDEHPFILARVPRPAFQLMVNSEPQPPFQVVLAGWAWGHECRKQEHWTDPYPGRFCYALPNWLLRPMETCPIPRLVGVYR